MGYVGLLLLCSITAVHLGPTLAGLSSEICLQMVEPGPCRGYFPRWFYNSTSNRCEVFSYGGCQGNLNRFETKQNCENACGCNLCTLQPETGPCRASIPSYYYNTTSGKCEQFIYGGCGGNKNRFRTVAECAGNCSAGESSCPVRGQIIEECPSRCSGTCNNPREPCLLQCPGDNCLCPPGKLIDTEANECIDPSQCPVNCSNVQCPSANCVIGVNATTPPGSCCPVCACEVGGKVYYAGDEFKIDCNNCSCVLGWPVCHTNEICEESASPQANRTVCPIEGQEYMECGSACPLTCKKPDPIPCTRQCVPGCQCPRGTVLDEENKRCVERHLCPVPSCDMCSLQPESGRCLAYFPSYFWNINRRRCERFIYGGCGGNSNRFPTLDMCQTKCACAGVNCNKGSQCKVHQPTGQAYCEPSCDIDNGGCPAEQICSLRNVTCIRAPCPPVVECECPMKNQVYRECGTACPPTCSNPNPRICTLQCVRGCQCRNGRVLDELQNKCVKANRCSCPPTCSHQFCSNRRNKKKPCSRPYTNSTISGCPNRCQSTHCDACYYSKLPRNTPQKCDNKVCSGEEATSRCLRRWAKCISRQNRRNNQCKGDCIVAENFRCYDYPPDACASN